MYINDAREVMGGVRRLFMLVTGKVSRCDRRLRLTNFATSHHWRAAAYYIGIIVRPLITVTTQMVTFSMTSG